MLHGSIGCWIAHTVVTYRHHTHRTSQVHCIAIIRSDEFHKSTIDFRAIALMVTAFEGSAVPTAEFPKFVIEVMFGYIHK